MSDRAPTLRVRHDDTRCVLGLEVGEDLIPCRAPGAAVDYREIDNLVAQVAGHAGQRVDEGDQTSTLRSVSSITSASAASLPEDGSA